MESLSKDPLFDESDSNVSSLEDNSDEEGHIDLIKRVKSSLDLQRASQAKVFSEPKIRNEFNVTAKQKITLEDLSAKMGDQSLKKKLISIGKEFLTESSKKPAKLVENREMERKVCYSGLAKEISRWNPLVKKHKRAKQLCFYNKQATIFQKPSLSDLSAKFAPTDEFSKEYAELLKTVGYGEGITKNGKNTAVEGLGEKTKHELSRRELLAERAKSKSAAFHSAIDAKRAKKIKSKDYRRRLKAARKREMDKLQKESLLSEESDAEALLLRAEERMSLRHKTTGKWAKRVARKPFLAGEKNIKRDFIEMQRIGKKRMEKVEKGDLGESGENGSAEENLFDVAEEEAAGEMEGKGLFSLAFMRRGMEKKRGDLEEMAEGILGEEGKEVIGVPKTVSFVGIGESNLAEIDKDAKEQKVAKMVKFDLEHNAAKDGQKSKEMKERLKSVLKQTSTFDTDSEEIDPSDSDENAKMAETGLDQADFEKEAEEMEEQSNKGNDKETSDSEAGWGSWAGIGLHPKKKKKKKSKKRNPKAPKATPKVILNKAKIDQTLAQVTLPQKPHGFASEKTYHKSLDQPVGLLWNNEADYKSGIEPNIKLRRGVPIDPISAGDSLVSKI